MVAQSRTGSSSSRAAGRGKPLQMERRIVSEGSGLRRVKRGRTIVDLEMDLGRPVTFLDPVETGHQLADMVRDRVSLRVSSLVRTGGRGAGQSLVMLAYVLERDYVHVDDLVSEEFLVARNHEDRAQSAEVAPARRHVRVRELRVRRVDLDLPSLMHVGQRREVAVSAVVEDLEQTVLTNDGRLFAVDLDDHVLAVGRVGMVLVGLPLAGSCWWLVFVDDSVLADVRGRVKIFASLPLLGLLPVAASRHVVPSGGRRVRCHLSLCAARGARRAVD